MAFGGLAGDGIPGLHARGILTVLELAQTGFQRLHSFQESLESVNQKDSTSIPTKNDVCALVQSKGEIVTFPSVLLQAAKAFFASVPAKRLKMLGYFPWFYSQDILVKCL